MPARTHISSQAAPIEVEPREQPTQPSYKPLGLWYEVDADWRRWCADEQPEWIAGRWLHRVTLGRERILRLSSAADLDDLTRRHGGHGPLEGGLGFVDWRGLADRFDGIEIAPYVWSRRLELMWYYGWDCASGVIWRPRGVRVEPIERLPLSLVVRSPSDAPPDP